MRVFLKIVSTAVLLLLPLAACAAQAKPVAVYSLKLSLGQHWNTRYTGTPELTITFINSGSYTLMFALPSSYPGFTVEYKATTGNPSSPLGWQKLKSSLEQPSYVRLPGKIMESANHVILAKIAPLRQGGPGPYGNEYGLVGFPMAADGFYRVTVAMKIPEAREMTGPANAQTEVRRLELDLRSNSIIICRTASGFLALP